MFDVYQFLAAAAAPGAEAGASGIVVLFNNFGIDLKIIVAQALNFIVVAFLLWKLAFGPVVATIEERQKRIADGLQYAEESKAQLAETEKKQAETLREAHAKAQNILQSAKERADEYLRRETEATSAKIEDMLARAREANELERQKMLGEVRQEIARLVVLTSGKVLRSELTGEQKSRINEAATREIAQLN